MENANLDQGDGITRNFSYVIADTVLSSTENIPPWLFSLLMEYISYAMIAVAFFGIPGNILIIGTYVKIGLSESINVSYCALGVSDILCVIFITWNAICFTPAFADSDVPMIAREVVILTGGFTSLICCNITAWITAFISLEKCLCVVYPLKIKSIISQKRTVFVVVIIFTLTAIPLTGITFYLYVFYFKYDTERNRTVLGVKYRNATAVVSVRSFNLIYRLVIMNLLPYTTIFLCSVFLAVYLNRSVSWRLGNSGIAIQENGSSSFEENKTNRKNAKEMRVVKTVLSLATAFIVSGTLGIMRLLVSIIWQEFRPLGTYGKAFRLIGRVGFLLSLANSSVNFVIYYTMGSKFKQSVNEIFHLKTRQKQESMQSRKHVET